MKYSDYYKIVHRRNKYNIKFLADFLTLFFRLSDIHYDIGFRTFSIPRHLVAALSPEKLNLLSRVISLHSYYDEFHDDVLLIKPLFPWEISKK